jgi:hypothetical protein
MITPKEFALGRKRSVPDVRNYKLAAFMPINLGDLSGEKLWGFNSEPLNQFDYPECTGFGLADFRISAPVENLCTNADGRSFYKMCKDLDGNSEPGSSVHTVARVGRKLGFIPNYAFALSVKEVVYWVLNKGPVIAGTDWMVDMFTPDKNNVVHPTGKLAGGHCYVVSGKTSNDLFRLKCAWGYDWGVKSEAFIAIEDFENLLQQAGEALTAVDLAASTVVNPQKEGCSTALANLFGLFK